MTRKSAVTFTMNSPESLVELWRLASVEKGKDMALEEKVYRAELIREVGLKCIGFNGVCFIFYFCHFLCHLHFHGAAHV